MTMRVVRHLADLPDRCRAAVVAIGNFDGVHLGHQTVIDAARRTASAASAPFAIMTFEPHPRRLFRPADPPFRLTPLRAKLERFAASDADLALVLRFDKRFAAQPAPHFIEAILANALAARHVVIGHNFCFGQGRAGNAALLEAAGRFGVTVVPAQVGPDGLPVSSTRIRDHLQAGAPQQAAQLLGRPFSISGHVRGGDRRGRLLGFPTANLALADYLRPRLGVYAVRARLPDGAPIDGVANLGERPTVDGKDVRLEVHLFDFAGDIYGRRLEVELIDFVRPEQRFAGLDALKAQIAADCATARAQLAAA